MTRAPLMKPSILYDQAVRSQKVKRDPAQERVLLAFDVLSAELLTPRPKSFWPFAKPKAPPKGLYIYGPVGRGKTYLMDLFYNSISVPKLRQHYYEFMTSIHADLKRLQGQADPLQHVVKDLAAKATVICLDEFFVEDIADAMILSTLLQGLFKAGVVLVTTSNVIPHDLYRNGLQRERFLPAIALIETKMQVLDLNHPLDYRLLHDFKSKNYHFPLADQDLFLHYHFAALKGEALNLDPHFVLNDWGFNAIVRTAKVIWFEFAEVCVKARSPLDYLALTETYTAILLQNIPALKEEDSNAARRFIALVDTCYDRRIIMILAAAVPLEELYQGQRLAFEFARTKSRLIEMAGWI